MALSVLFKMTHLEMSFENMERLAFILECFILLFTINKNITQISILLLLLFLSNNIRDFPGDSVVRNSPATAGDARDLGWIPGLEDPLEKEMATYSSILAWKIPWTEEPGGLQSMGLQRIGYDSATNTFFLSCICIIESLCCTPETNTAL